MLWKEEEEWKIVSQFNLAKLCHPFIRVRFAEAEKPVPVEAQKKFLSTRSILVVLSAKS